MQLYDAVQKRRAVKHYDPDFVMSEEEIKLLVSQAMLTPTAFNIQHWRFVLVRDPELRSQLRAVGWDQSQITDASLLFILCGDRKAWEKESERYWRSMTPELQKATVASIDAYYRGKEQVQRDEVMRSCGMAAQTLMLTAKSMGYDSSPMVGFDFEAVARLINLPKDHVVVMMLAIGKGIKPARPRGGQLPMDEVLILDRFS
ncbi:MAG: nitroreductase family protein [Candidatus Hydrogenedentes bacterium]|jgi:nitroreductase|nr:nitroreductase family protein [Candidatus Hydrogenedentota bacterium]